MAYAGSNREAVLSLLTPVFSDPKSSMEVVGMAGLACGMIAVGSCNPDVTATIVQTLMEKSETELHDTYARFLPLGLGLCHLGEFTFTSSARMLCCRFSGLIPLARSQNVATSTAVPEDPKYSVLGSENLCRTCTLSDNCFFFSLSVVCGQLAECLILM